MAASESAEDRLRLPRAAEHAANSLPGLTGGATRDSFPESSSSAAAVERGAGAEEGEGGLELTSTEQGAAASTAALLASPAAGSSVSVTASSPEGVWIASLALMTAPVPVGSAAAAAAARPQKSRAGSLLPLLQGGVQPDDKAAVAPTCDGAASHEVSAFLADEGVDNVSESRLAGRTAGACVYAKPGFQQPLLAANLADAPGKKTGLEQTRAHVSRTMVLVGEHLDAHGAAGVSIEELAARTEMKQTQGEMLPRSSSLPRLASMTSGASTVGGTIGGREEEERWVPYYLTPRTRFAYEHHGRKMKKVFTFVDRGPGNASLYLLEPRRKVSGDDASIPKIVCGSTDPNLFGEKGRKEQEARDMTHQQALMIAIRGKDELPPDLRVELENSEFWCRVDASVPRHVLTVPTSVTCRISLCRAL